MLYIFYGTDEAVAREKARNLIKGLQQKAPDAELMRVTNEDVGTVDIAGLLGTQGLFKSNYIIFLDNVSEILDCYTPKQLAVKFKAMQESAHICVLLAGKLDAKILRQYSEYANKITEYKLGGRAAKSSEFNVFSVANALKARNKQQLWQSLAEARLLNIEPEAITGMLFWAVKDMLIKGQYSKWREQETKELAISIAKLPHKARREGVSLHNTLEKFALERL